MSEPVQIANRYEHLLNANEILVMQGLASAVSLKDVAAINRIPWSTAYNIAYSAGRKMGIEEAHLQTITLTWVRGETTCNALDLKTLASQMVRSAMEVAERNLLQRPHERPHIKLQGD